MPRSNGSLGKQAGQLSKGKGEKNNLLVVKKGHTVQWLLDDCYWF